MGHSFLEYKGRSLRMKDGTLGLLCAIIAKEIGDLPEESNLRSGMDSLRKEISEQAYYSGYDTVIDLTPFIQNRDQLETHLAFLELVISKLRAFGSVLPQTYLTSLSGGQHYQKEHWTASEVCDLLGEVKDMLAASER